MTLNDLRNKQIIYASAPVVYRKYEKEGFKTPSKKVECYSERFKSCNYEPLPVFQYPKESHMTKPEWLSKSSLLGTTRKPAEFVHTKHRNLPEITKTYPDPLVWVHPTDARTRGVRQNEIVEVKSPRGRIQVKAKITEDVGPGLVAIDFGWGNPSDMKSNLNLLTSDEVWDPISGGYPNRLFLCEIEKLVKA